MRKTVNVDTLLEKFNSALANPNYKQQTKAGIAAAAEMLLFEADRYAGFRYLEQSYNSDTDSYDHPLDTEYNRQYSIKEMK